MSTELLLNYGLNTLSTRARLRYLTGLLYVFLSRREDLLLLLFRLQAVICGGSWAQYFIPS